MKRIGNLWPELTGFANLLAAAQAAAAGKRRRPDVAAFLLDLEPNLFALQRELLAESYQPGPYRTFTILDPKPRQISAAPFRDRVIHHALTRVLEPIFERRFSPHSYACRVGKGTHKALACSREGVRRYPYALKCDVRKYFASIDHEILNEQLRRVIKCAPTLRLAAAIIAGSNPQEEAIQYFPGDDLFTPFERRRGLPLGNQTSQFFANVYLHPLDTLIGERLRPGLWARYVDDLILFANDKRGLRAMREAIEVELAGARLTLHPRKSVVRPCGGGITFLGWRLASRGARLTRGNVVRFGRRMKRLGREFASGAADWQQVEQSVRAWIAHASFGGTQVLRERLFERFAFDWGARPLRAGGVLQQRSRRQPARRLPEQERT